jgi:mono/diheme cytochrome c family protein
MKENEMRLSVIAATLFGAAALASAAGNKGAAKAALIEEGRLVFETNCAACHGPAGQGDGPAAAALDPKPRNLADAAYMKTRPAATLRKVIEEGGQSVGLSPVMVGWKASLTPAQIDAVLAFVQSLGKPAPKNPVAKKAAAK